MFCADAAVVLFHEGEDVIVDFTGFGEEGGFVHVCRLKDIDVEVAVADVSEEADFPAGVFVGEEGLQAFAELQELGDGQGDVIFVGHACCGQAFADGFAKLPKLPGLLSALGQYTVHHHVLHTLADPRFKGLEVFCFDFKQGIVAGSGFKGHAQFAVLLYASKALAGEKFKGAQGKGGLACAEEQVEDVFEAMCGQQEDVGFGRNAHEFEGCFGDDAQNALAADEKLPQVNARVVFFQGVVELQHGAVGENDFHAQHPLARQAIADDAYTTDVGGDVAANLAGAFGCQVNRPEEAVLSAMLMHGFRRGSGLHFKRLSQHVHVAKGAHFFEGQNGFTLGCHSAAGKSCAPP